MIIADPVPGPSSQAPDERHRIIEHRRLAAERSRHGQQDRGVADVRIHFHFDRLAHALHRGGE
ncbi:hypothetical protein [Rhodanobacter sp. B05]|uniref:hypothetical protein n=1 Tax=Rhodanobacter sp. B05 TaxID=1945859 RepID=UPI00143910B3|nr:hypothetical protein [Rhodanobacter sp. B05]